MVIFERVFSANDFRISLWIEAWPAWTFPRSLIWIMRSPAPTMWSPASIVWSPAGLFKRSAPCKSVSSEPGFDNAEPSPDNVEPSLKSVKPSWLLQTLMLGFVIWYWAPWFCCPEVPPHLPAAKEPRIVAEWLFLNVFFQQTIFGFRYELKLGLPERFLEA